MTILLIYSKRDFAVILHMCYACAYRMKLTKFNLEAVQIQLGSSPNSTGKALIQLGSSPNSTARMLPSGISIHNLRAFLLNCKALVVQI